MWPSWGESHISSTHPVQRCPALTGQQSQIKEIFIILSFSACLITFLFETCPKVSIVAIGIPEQKLSVKIRTFLILPISALHPLTHGSGPFTLTSATIQQDFSEAHQHFFPSPMEYSLPATPGPKKILVSKWASMFQYPEQFSVVEPTFRYLIHIKIWVKLESS